MVAVAVAVAANGLGGFWCVWRGGGGGAGVMYVCNVVDLD